LIASEAASAQSTLMQDDWETQSVCVLPDGSLDQLHAPGNDTCGHMRKLRLGEMPNYRLSDWPSRSDVCPYGGGPIEKINIPVQVQERIRNISFYTARPDDTGCRGPYVGESIGASIEYQDRNYAFIMGSWSPVALSQFVSPLCSTYPEQSERYYDAWLTGRMTTNPAGTEEMNVSSALRTGSTLSACPLHYAVSFTTLTRAPFAYKSGKIFLSSISSHFSTAAKTPARAAVGTAQQRERTYLTREFGLTRWEKWSREDWRSPSGGTAQSQARQLVQRGRCSLPYQDHDQAGHALSYGRIVVDADGYHETLTDTLTHETHIWYLTRCEDFSNIVYRGVPSSMLEEARRSANPQFWK